jgi:hypothetical protein
MAHKPFSGNTPYRMGVRDNDDIAGLGPWSRTIKHRVGLFPLDVRFARVTSCIPDKGQVAAIDMAVRPPAHCRYRQEESFIGWAAFYRAIIKALFIRGSEFNLTSPRITFYHL